VCDSTQSFFKQYFVYDSTQYLFANILTVHMITC